jgi:O-antigen ligase
MRLSDVPPRAWVAAAAVGGAVAGAVIALFPTLVIPVIGVVTLVVALVTAIASPRLGILWVFLAIPLDTYGRVISYPITVTAFQLLLIAVLASWLFRVLKDRALPSIGAAELVAAGVLVAGLWSFPYSLSGSATMVACGRIAFDAALAIACINLIDTSERLRRAGTVLAATILAVAVYALAQYAFPGVLPGVTMLQGTIDRTNLERVAALFLDPNTLGGLMSMAAASFLALAAHARRRTDILLWLVAAGIAAAAMVVTFSRGSWIAFVLVLPIVGLTAPSDRRRAILTGLVAVVVAGILLAPGVIVSRVQSAFDIEHDTSAATRYYMYISAVEIARDHPIFGTGLGASDVAYPAYQKPQALPGILKPHEIPVALVAETGLGGLAVLAALAWMLIRALRRHRGRSWTTAESAAAVGLAALLVGSLFENYLYFQYLWIIAALWVIAARMAAAGEGDSR